MQEKAKCVEEHRGPGAEGPEGLGPMCLDKCRATLWRATPARQLVSPIIEDRQRLPLVQWAGHLGMPRSRHSASHTERVVLGGAVEKDRLRRSFGEELRARDGS